MVQTETKVATSTLVIPLFDGKILSKSKVNLQKFVDSLDSNLKKAIVEPILKEIGLNVHVSGGETTLNVENDKLLKEYFEWKQEKAKYQQKLVLDTSKVLKEKFATAEEL